MINFLIAAIFILSIAITSGSVLISSHLRTTYKSGFFSTLLFFQVFYFTFGFYAIGGQVIITTLLSPFITQELLAKVVDVTVFLGLPFLVFSFLMFIRLCQELSGRKISNSFVWLYLLINVVMILAIGYVLRNYPKVQAITIVKYYFLLLSFLFTLLGIFYLILSKKTQLGLGIIDLKNISIGLVSIMVVQNTILLLYNHSIYLTFIFTFIYFVNGAFMPLYIRYKSDLSKLLTENETCESFEQFCKKFEISPRETEIVNKICKGLSNQQIADKLFISLQTVKDHTHRIYSKTNCSSRSQLMNLVNSTVAGKLT